MTEPDRPAGRPSQAALGLLAALVGLALLLAGILVGAVPATAGNRVGASTPVMINTVGSSAGIGAGQRLGKTVPQPSFVVATGVAAETADAAPGLTRTFQTYTKVNSETGEVYAGRTSGYGSPLENLARRDAGHAYNDLGFGPARLDQSSESYAAIRGREQQLIQSFRDQGISANKINGISPTNPNLPWYMQSATDAFGSFP